MRIWDINPGYLNRQSLLGEHRELHGIASVIINSKKGYSRHPETLRWKGRLGALKMRHALLAAEMSLRGFHEASPVTAEENIVSWPGKYIDRPIGQFELLKEKYREREPGRIPLPEHAQELWSQHKYSIMARDIALYKQTGKQVAHMRSRDDFSGLAETLAESLRIRPKEGGIRNALQHMWGYVSDFPPDLKVESGSWPLGTLLAEVQKRALKHKISYLIASTALGELGAWLPDA